MKQLFFFFSLIIFSASAFTQTINKISTYYNGYNTTSGIIGINEFGIYEYSWYYAEWLSFPTNGLAIVGGKPKIDAVSAFDNSSLNPSGIYVLSDTAIHVYNHYAEYWYPLKNDGLNRVNGIIQISDLSAHNDAEDDQVYVFAKSGDFIYRYNWYLKQWYPLTNNGLSTKIFTESSNVKVDIFPNPVISNSKLKIDIPENFSGDLRLAFFNEDSKFIKEIVVHNLTTGAHEINLSTEGFDTGIYFCEIFGLNFSHVKKFIKFE